MEENKRRRRISTPLLLFLILMGITLALCLTVLGIWLHGRSVLRSKTAEPPAISTDSSVLDQHTIYHDGKYYRYKDGLVNLLFIGVDCPTATTINRTSSCSPCSIRTVMR